MAYSYGASPVHGYPTPLDGTPLDAESWAHLVDALGVGIPYVVASLAEQTAYLNRLVAAGRGPSSTNIVRVTRVDLEAMVLRHDGTGWKRESGGSLKVAGFANAAATEVAGTISTRGAVALNLPAVADVEVQAVVTGIPPAAPDAWAFYVWLEDHTGRELSPRIVYSNLPRTPYPAIVPTVAEMPAGSSQIRLRTQVNAQSGPITWAHVSITANYA